MKIVSRQNAVHRKNSEVCAVTEYPIESSSIDIAIVKINGRYPETGRVVNNVCHEIIYVQEGRGKIIVDNKEHILETGDVVLVEPQEKYFWEGNLNLVISCHPAFTLSQHQKVD